MFDYMITYGGPEILVGIVVFVVTPIVYFSLLRRRAVWLRILALALLWGGTVYVGYWDVYQIAKETERLCREEAGLHVFRTVEAEGFLGVFSIEHWASYGFRYVEYDLRGKKVRYTIVEGKVEETLVDEFLSRYEYVYDGGVPFGTSFNRHSKMVQDRQSEEVLGELVYFSVYPGWIDSRWLGWSGFTFTPRICDNDDPPDLTSAWSLTDLIKAVVKPVKEDRS